jgi:hypothetical protein
MNAAGAETEAAETSETIDVVVLTADLKVGEKILDKNVEVKTFKNVNIPGNVISSVDQVVGLIAATNLYKGEYVYKEQLSKAPVKAEVNNALLLRPIEKTTDSYITVTDYFPANTGKDVTALIQQLIDVNPNRTIYFPDGEYLISSPIMTQSDPKLSSAIYLSDGAVIKAIKETWKKSTTTEKKLVDKGKATERVVLKQRDVNTLVALGGAGTHTNDNRSVGSYFYFMGGTLDGNGVADGISFEQGREPLIRNVCIKNFKHYGLWFARGTNSTSDNSSDSDVEDITIIGNGSANTIGLAIGSETENRAYDNTVTNVRIYDCQIGLLMNSGGNSLRDIRVYYTPSSKTNAISKVYQNTVGIKELCVGNFVYHCYVENYAVAYSFHTGTTVVDSCSAVWTTSEGSGTKERVAYQGKVLISNCAAKFFDKNTTNYYSKNVVSIECPRINDVTYTLRSNDPNNKTPNRGKITPIK